MILWAYANGSSINTLTTNYGEHIDFIARDRNGSLYTNCHSNDRIRQYRLDTLPGGVIVAGSGSSVTGTFSDPRGIAIDDNFNLYVGDRGTDLIVKLASGGSSLMRQMNVSLYATGIGALLLPHGTSSQIYFSDESGTSVFLWTFGATTPDLILTNVLGGTTLTAPRGLKVDSFGNLYVADKSNNRIVAFCANTTVGIVIVNTPSSPSDLAFDSQMNLYVLQSDGKLYMHKRL